MTHKTQYRYISPLNLSKFYGIAAMAFVFQGEIGFAEPVPLPDAAADVTSADTNLPDQIGQDVSDLELPSDGVGYYPTIDETMLLGGDYPRSSGGQPNNPPDVLMQREQGLYPYPNPGQGYRAPWADSISPLNPYLGFFAPREALITSDGNAWPRGSSFTLDSSFPLLVRDFSPERAMLKAGPTYFDLLFVGMTVLHSDYQGSQIFADGEEDGWLVGIEFGLRGMVQFTDQFYVSLATTLVYLPLENKVGVRLGMGGGPTALAAFEFQTEYKSWDILIYDRFYATLSDDLFLGLDSGANQRAGRYNFGFDSRRREASDLFNGESTFFTNVIGVDASTPVWDSWRLWLSARHFDTWRTWGFDDHAGRNTLQATLGYNGNDLWFSPALEYYLGHDQETDSVDHRLYLTFKGRLAENLSLIARGGYYWNDGNSSNGDGYLYSIALNHELSRYTSHSLSFGRDYFSNDLTGQSLIATYTRYNINHTFSRALDGAASIQYSEDDSEEFDGERTNVSASLRYSFLNGYNSGILLNGAYEHRNGTLDGDRWLGRLTYTQSLFTRTTGELFYQYEESSGDDDFNEQLFGCTIRRYF